MTDAADAGVSGGQEPRVIKDQIASFKARNPHLDNAKKAELADLQAKMYKEALRSLRTFINADQTSDHTIIARVAIHATFLISALALAWTDRQCFDQVQHGHLRNPAAGSASIYLPAAWPSGSGSLTAATQGVGQAGPQAQD